MIDPDIFRCTKCKSEEVYQEASQLYNVNGSDDCVGDLHFNDYYYCGNCQDECTVEQEPPKPTLKIEMILP